MAILVSKSHFIEISTSNWYSIEISFETFDWHKNYSDKLLLKDAPKISLKSQNCCRFMDSVRILLHFGRTTMR